MEGFAKFVGMLRIAVMGCMGTVGIENVVSS